MDPIEVVDNLLTFITVKEMSLHGEHIEHAQKRLSANPWVVDALKYLKEQDGAAITLACSEWIDRVNP